MSKPPAQAQALRVAADRAPAADFANLPPPVSGPPDPGLPGLKALCFVARLHHVAADPAHLQHALGKSASETLTADDLLLAGRSLGLKLRRSRTPRTACP